MKIKAGFLFALIVALGTYVACSADDEGPNVTCIEDTPTCTGTFDTCCSTTQCYYVYNGNRYNCNGLDCDAAAAELAADAGCSTRLDNIDTETIMQTSDRIITQNKTL